MDLQLIFRRKDCVVRVVLTAAITLGLVAANIGTVNADPQRSSAPVQQEKSKIKWVKKYVKVTGSNIPVPVWIAERPLPQTSYPIRSYTAEELRKFGAQTPAEGLAHDPSVFIQGR